MVVVEDVQVVEVDEAEALRALDGDRDHDEAIKPREADRPLISRVNKGTNWTK